MHLTENGKKLSKEDISPVYFCHVTIHAIYIPLNTMCPYFAKLH